MLDDMCEAVIKQMEGGAWNRVLPGLLFMVGGGAVSLACTKMYMHATRTGLVHLPAQCGGNQITVVARKNLSANLSLGLVCVLSAIYVSNWSI